MSRASGFSFSMLWGLGVDKRFTEYGFYGLWFLLQRIRSMGVLREGLTGSRFMVLGLLCP